MIIANVPFAAVAGVVSLYMTGQYLSVPSAIGFIAVFGMAMLNGVVLISFINQLREEGVALAEAECSIISNNRGCRLEWKTKQEHCDDQRRIWT
jgi:Cu/Ag efflux pump CusA